MIIHFIFEPHSKYLLLCTVCRDAFTYTVKQDMLLSFDLSYMHSSLGYPVNFCNAICVVESLFHFILDACSCVADSLRVPGPADLFY